MCVCEGEKERLKERKEAREIVRMCDGVRSGEKVFACVHACTCTCLCVFERPPPAAVTLADSLGVEGL